ncbi:tRNA uridine-5-carboxymethylaminomethyl(34) synthesis GTPase MnmE [Lentisphaerota bacterium ZTH]|nr:tRNA uridine-5-carboxymethylaminomethyl(34) synthesis GTPase MnmE [Lentisphaerota bacterium]WET07144.1 tRNA uridine-5-carboxymethylaminomethyl(34) synthesis GTPase MnmE [Lentisphaerota bacterium ZTH]
MNTEDNISAICTGAGGAISIIRISGPDALSIGNKTWSGKELLNRKNARRMLFGKTVSDQNTPGDTALAVYMPGPNSYTGDDVVELHCHGGALASRQTLEAALKAGARPAEPGEFTFRAFVNGKMDLTRAEAVSDIISAHSDMALHLAERQVQGSLARGIDSLHERLIAILAECESRMDFGEEDLDWTEPDQFIADIEEAGGAIQKLLQTGRDGAVLREGIRVVLAGRPNAGKSSLLNLLLGFDRAIVTQLPGTTRDTLEETANLRGIPVKLIDTAGIREATDIIEGIGIDRSRQSIEQAQIVFWLLDASAESLEEELLEMTEHTSNKDKIIAIWNKTDIAAAYPLPALENCPTLEISVSENTNINQLLDTFEKMVWDYPHTEEPEIAVNTRHMALLEEAIEALPPAALNLSENDWELAAVHLRAAIAALGQVTGENIDPDILDNIFSKFCIGK